jgi:dTMP kinase
LTIVVDVDPKIGLVRVRERKREQLVLPKLGNAELFDRMENQGLEFYNRVRQGYLDLAKDEPSRVKVVDGSQPIDLIAAQIWELVSGVL